MWKHIIVLDLYNGFFQNHLSRDSLEWLGVMTPFGGLRVITRSAQGLLGMSEEFNLLVKKIIKEELHEGKCCQIIDDVFIGGETQEEAAATYIKILNKFKLANSRWRPPRPSSSPSRWTSWAGCGDRAADWSPPHTEGTPWSTRPRTASRR